MQDAGRDLQKYVNKKMRVHVQLERANLFERFIPEVADALSRLTGKKKEPIQEGLAAMVKKDDIQQRIATMQAVNTDYDEEWAKIGKDDEEPSDGMEEPAKKTKADKTEAKEGD